MFKILILLMMLQGCADNTYREYNADDRQDPSCIGSYGGRHGYCNVFDRNRK